jgi:hypothetical protein
LLEIITNGVGITLTVLYGVLLSGEFRSMGVARTSPISPWTWLVVVVHLAALIFRGIQIGACPVDSHWETRLNEVIDPDGRAVVIQSPQGE